MQVSSRTLCACHVKGSRGPSGDHARRSSSRRLCVLRLPRERQPRPQRRPLCTAPATRKAAAAPAATTRPAAPPGGSVYCACHAKGSRGPSGDQPPRLLQDALCTAPATRKAAAAPAATTRAAAPPGGSVYCACHAKEAE